MPVRVLLCRFEHRSLTTSEFDVLSDLDVRCSMCKGRLLFDIEVKERIVVVYVSKCEQCSPEDAAIAEDIYQSGIDDGYVEGYREGLLKGREEGYQAGYSAGQENKNEELYNKGYEEGLRDGHSQGYWDGQHDGYFRGYADGYSAEHPVEGSNLGG